MKKNHYKNYDKNKYTKPIAKCCIFCFKTIIAISLLTILSVSCIFVYDVFTQCNYFKMKDLSIEGTCKFSEKQILKQAGISRGANILSVNLSTAKKRLLTHSWIIDAEIKRKLPSKIIIKIKEHKPLAILDLGDKFIIDINGKIFKEKIQSDADNLPIITGLKIADINGCRNISFDSVMTVLHILAQSKNMISNEIMRQIKVDREIGLTIYVSNSVDSNNIKAIKLGYNNYSSKFAMLKKALFYIDNNEYFEGFKSIDINNLNRIVVSPEPKGV